VTSELLLDPVQTSCCWENLSRAVSQQHQAAGKPCRFCNKAPLVVVEDADLKRRVEQLKKHHAEKMEEGQLLRVVSSIRGGKNSNHCTSFDSVKITLQI
ncbi:hypothetical protein GBAR_LOCUS11768, partial [Geodia barretti]